MQEAFIIGQKEEEDEGVFVYVLPENKAPRLTIKPFINFAQLLNKVYKHQVYNLSDFKSSDLRELVESNDFTLDLENLEKQYVHGLRKVKQ